MKKLLNVALVFAILFTSCKKETQPFTETVAKEKISNFASIQTKIAEVSKFKKEQESQIMAKILKRRNLSAPLMNDFKPVGNTNRAINEADLLEDLQFYHTERIKVIYAERMNFNFTSIQSIADEINSLKLLNPVKADELFAKYKSLLLKNEYEISSVFNNTMASVISDKGELLLENKNIAANFLKKEKVDNASARVLKSGFVASGYNEFIKIAYTTDIYELIEFIPNVPNSAVYYFRPQTTLGCYVLSPNGYVLYNCYFYTGAGSRADFYKGCSSFQRVAFSSGIGSLVHTDGFYQQYNNSCAIEYVTGVVSGSFAVPAGSTLLWVSGSATF
jgi:hypothetical protein